MHLIMTAACDRRLIPKQDMAHAATPYKPRLHGFDRLIRAFAAVAVLDRIGRA